MIEDIKKDTLKGVKWTAIEKIALQGIQFVIGLILARLLSPSDFGLVGMLAIFISISQTFIDGGFSNALIRKIDRTETDCSTAFYFNIVVGIVCYGILFLISPLVADFFNTPILSDLLKIIGLSIFVNSLEIVQVAKLTVDINFKAQARATVFSVTLSGCIGIAMAYHGYGVWALAWQTVFGAIFRCVILWYQTKWKPMLVFSKASFTNLFSYGSKLLASNLLGTIYANMTTLAIGKFYTPKDLGYYSRGQQFAHLPSTAIIDTIGRVTFPILAKIQNDDERLVSVYRKYIRVTSIPIIFFLMLLAAVAKPLILVLLTEKWLDATLFLQIFCFAFMTEHISKLNLNLLQVKGRSDLYLRLEVIKKVIAFLILMCSIPFGVVIICVSKVLNGQVSLFINTYYTGKLFGLGYLKQFSDFIKYLTVSLLACLPAYVLTFTTIAPILQLAIGCVTACILYYVMLRKDNIMIEIRSTIINKIKK